MFRGSCSTLQENKFFQTSNGITQYFLDKVLRKDPKKALLLMNMLEANPTTLKIGLELEKRQCGHFFLFYFTLIHSSLGAINVISVYIETDKFVNGSSDK